MKMRDAKGFTLIELLIVVAIIGIIAAIAVPGLLRARMSGNEASAIGSLRAVNSGQTNFAANCAQGSYANTLVNLALAPVGGGEGFISQDLAADPAKKSGFTVTLTAGAATTPTQVCSAATTASSYAVNADPQTAGSTGTRWFFSNGGTIYQNTTATIAPVQLRFNCEWIETLPCAPPASPASRSSSCWSWSPSSASSRRSRRRG